MFTDEEALQKAKDEYNLAIYLHEYGANRGIRVINGNKAEWLIRVVRLAEQALVERVGNKCLQEKI